MIAPVFIDQHARVRLERDDIIDRPFLVGVSDETVSPGAGEGPQEFAARMRLREHLELCRRREADAGRPLSGRHPLILERDRLYRELKRVARDEARSTA